MTALILHMFNSFIISKIICTKVNTTTKTNIYCFKTEDFKFLWSNVGCPEAFEENVRCDNI